jgi:hypothetical protein
LRTDHHTSLDAMASLLMAAPCHGGASDCRTGGRTNGLSETVDGNYGWGERYAKVGWARNQMGVDVSDIIYLHGTNK